MKTNGVGNDEKSEAKMLREGRMLQYAKEGNEERRQREESKSPYCGP